MNNYILTPDMKGLMRLPQIAIQELIDNGKIKVNGELFMKEDLLFKEDEIQKYEESIKRV